MFLALLAVVTAAQQVVAGDPPPPPPPPPQATTPVVRAAIGTAEACFEKRWDLARDRRFAAERLVRPLSAPLGSPEWMTARTAVLALVKARRELAQCAQIMSNSVRPVTDADRAALDYEARFMVMNISEQARYETDLLIGLIDRSYPNPTLGNYPRP